MTLRHDEIRALFVEEAQVRLERLRELARQLEPIGADQSLVESAFREAYTIRGSAAVAGLLDVCAIARELEELLDDLRAGRRSSDVETSEALRGGADRLARAIVGAGGLGNEPQDDAVQIRMAPLATVTSQLHVAVRDLAWVQGKDVRWEVRGGDIELDRGVLRWLSDCLLHLIRNAVDHGIELPAERGKAGKPMQGRVSLRAEQVGSEVIIAITDDGRGVDIDAVREQAALLGIDEDGLTDDEALDLTFRSGLSTTCLITGVSGRGAGLDVVRAEVEGAGGRVELRSTRDVGTEVRLIVPTTVAAKDVAGSPLRLTALIPTATVLVADDSLVVRRTVRARLEVEGYHVVEACDGTEALASCRAMPPDVALLNVEMPGMGGHELLEVFQSEQRLCEIPVVMLTGRTPTADLVAALGSGARDYLRKPFEPAELVARVGAAVRVKRLQDRLHALSTTDILTGLPNRRFLTEQLAQRSAAAQRSGSQLAVLLFDVDDFKLINDKFGHSVGDAVLREFGARLRATVRAGDVAGRWGGEEFLVIVSGATIADAQEVAERIRQAIAREPVVVDGHPIAVTASAGCAVGTGAVPDELLQAADVLLYRAKHEGRNVVCVSSAGEHDTPAATNDPRHGRTDQRHAASRRTSRPPNTCLPSSKGDGLGDAREEVGRARKRHAALLRSSAGPVFVMDNNRRFTEANPATERQLGSRVGDDGEWMILEASADNQLGNVGEGIAFNAPNVPDCAEHRTQIEANFKALVLALGRTVECRDPYTADHQRRVADMSATIATALGLPAHQIEGLYLGALVHDIGKLAVPAEILAYPGPLSPERFALVKEHSKAGHDILAGIPFPWPIAQIVLQHHERMDGSGYPDALVGDKILIEARVLAIADVADSMTSHRPYRPALGLSAARDELRRGRGVRYDAAAVDAFLRSV